MANAKCKECGEEFARTHAKQLYCEKHRPKDRHKAKDGRRTKGKHVSKVGQRTMPVEVHYCFNCGMPQPKEVVIG